MRGPMYVKDLAKDFRKKSTPAEALLWKALRDKQMDGVKFHRQRPFERYVLDFYAPSVKLVIEVDGEVHDNPSQKEYDQIREDFLKEHGLKVIRFRNEQVMKDIEFCKSEIHRAILN